MKCLIVFIVVFGALSVQSFLTVGSNDEISCIVDYLKMKGLLQSDVSFKSYSGTQDNCNEIIRREVDEFYDELNTKKFEYLSVYRMNDDSALRHCMTNIYKLYNVSDYNLKGKFIQYLNATDYEVDPDKALDYELPKYSSMMCQIDKYVTYQYDIFAEALVDTKGETQEKDCLIEHLIELKKLPIGLESLVVTPNHPSCNETNNKHYKSIRESYTSEPSTTLFAMAPSKNYELCIRTETTKEHSDIMQYAFTYLPQERIDEGQKKQIKEALDDSMKTLAKIYFECLKMYWIVKKMFENKV